MFCIRNYAGSLNSGTFGETNPIPALLACPAISRVIPPYPGKPWGNLRVPMPDNARLARVRSHTER